MTYNLLSHEIGFDGIASHDRKNDIVSLINAVNPHILCLQEMSIDYYGALKSETSLKFISPISYFLSSTMTVLMYDPDRLNLIEYGTTAYRYSTNPRLRSYTWGYFEDKKTKKCFLALNTHLNLYEQATAYPILQATELIEFCKHKEEQYKCPVFISGDFNTMQSEEKQGGYAVYDYITLFYDDSKIASLSKSYGAAQGLSAPVNDYIFYSAELDIISYILLSQPTLNMLSDHYPLFIDVDLS